MDGSKSNLARSFTDGTSDLLPLALGFEHPRLFDEIQPPIRRVVHERDHCICRYCGFHSQQYQQTIMLGSNWRELDTIVTTCIFCQQCFSLESAGRMRSGVLIHFPELGQAYLNRLGWELYVRRQSSRTSRLAKACLDMLMERRTGAVEHVGTDNPRILAGQIREATSEALRAVLQSRLSSIRLFPLDRRIVLKSNIEFNQWPQILAYIRSPDGPYGIAGRNRFFLLEEFSSRFM